MKSHIGLQPDFTLYSSGFTNEEIMKILPSQYEMSVLTFQKAIKQTAYNALAYSKKNQLSCALSRMLRYWLFILEEYEELLALTKNSTFFWDNLWQIMALGGIHKTNRGLFDLMHIIPAKPDDHELLHAFEDIAEPLFRISGEPRIYISLLQDMMNNQEFLTNNLIEISVFAFFIGPAMILNPEANIETIKLIQVHLQVWNLEYLTNRLLGVYGTVLLYSPRIEQSTAVFEQVETYAKNNEFPFAQQIENNRGISLYYTGRFEEATKIYLSQLEQDPDNLSAMNNLADIYSRIDMKREAWKYAKRYIDEATNIFILNYEFAQEIMYELGLHEELKKLITKMRILKEENENPSNAVGLLLVEARQARFDLNIGLALQKTDEALNMTAQWKNLQLMYLLMIEKIKIHTELADLRPTDNNKQRLLNVIDTFIQLSDEQQVAIGSINGLTMRADVYRSNGNNESAREDLKTAIKIAGKFELTNIQKKLQIEIAELSSKEEESLKESRFSRLKSIIKQMVGFSGGNYQKVEFTTHGVLVMSKGGLAIFTEYITDVLKTDSSLISGLISAISAMLNEATQTNGFLRTIQRDDFALIFEPLDDYLVVLVVSNDSFAARQLLSEFTKRTRELLKVHNLLDKPFEITELFENDMINEVNQLLL